MRRLPRTSRRMMRGWQVLKRSVPAATLAVRRKDIYRVREEVSVSANKPNIETILWQEMRLRDVSVRPLDGKLHLDGELSVFLIYSGEGEHTPVQWLEESIPFSGEVELSEAVEEMIPAVGVRILHAEAGKKPDSDGRCAKWKWRRCWSWTSAFIKKNQWNF